MLDALPKDGNPWCADQTGQLLDTIFTCIVLQDAVKAYVQV